MVWLLSTSVLGKGNSSLITKTIPCLLSCTLQRKKFNMSKIITHHVSRVKIHSHQYTCVGSILIMIKENAPPFPLSIRKLVKNCGFYTTQGHFFATTNQGGYIVLPDLANTSLVIVFLDEDFETIEAIYNEVI